MDDIVKQANELLDTIYPRSEKANQRRLTIMDVARQLKNQHPNADIRLNDYMEDKRDRNIKYALIGALLGAGAGVGGVGTPLYNRYKSKPVKLLSLALSGLGGGLAGFLGGEATSRFMDDPERKTRDENYKIV